MRLLRQFHPVCHLHLLLLWVLVVLLIQRVLMRLWHPWVLVVLLIQRVLKHQWHLHRLEYPTHPWHPWALVVLLIQLILRHLLIHLIRWHLLHL